MNDSFGKWIDSKKLRYKYIDYNDVNEFIEAIRKILYYDIDNYNDNLFLILNMTCQEFIDFLPILDEKLKLDLEQYLKHDPSINSIYEVINYNLAFYAILCYRIAHKLYLLKFYELSKLVSSYAYSKTAIDINPNAIIGDSFFIDHGCGVVIGETTIIKDNVKIYQGVTLGANKFIKNKKRHPTIENNVTLFANCSILGDIKVGKNSIISAGVYVFKDVPECSNIRR